MLIKLNVTERQLWNPGFTLIKILHLRIIFFELYCLLWFLLFKTYWRRHSLSLFYHPLSKVVKSLTFDDKHIIIKYVYVNMFKISCCQYHIIPRMLRNYILLYVVILVTIIIFSLPGHQSVLLSINTYISELPVQDIFSINMERIFQRPVSFLSTF